MIALFAIASFDVLCWRGCAWLFGVVDDNRSFCRIFLISMSWNIKLSHWWDILWSTYTILDTMTSWDKQHYVYKLVVIFHLLSQAQCAVSGTPGMIWPGCRRWVKLDSDLFQPLSGNKTLVIFSWLLILTTASSSDDATWKRPRVGTQKRIEFNKFLKGQRDNTSKLLSSL